MLLLIRSTFFGIPFKDQLIRALQYNYIIIMFKRVGYF